MKSRSSNRSRACFPGTPVRDRRPAPLLEQLEDARLPAGTECFGPFGANGARMRDEFLGDRPFGSGPRGLDRHLALFGDELAPIVVGPLPDEPPLLVDQLVGNALLRGDDVADLAVFPEGFRDEAPHGVFGEGLRGAVRSG